jgi:hypothetical protein
MQNLKFRAMNDNEKEFPFSTIAPTIDRSFNKIRFISILINKGELNKIELLIEYKTLNRDKYKWIPLKNNVRRKIINGIIPLYCRWYDLSKRVGDILLTASCIDNSEFDIVIYAEVI